jgi:hypothetical protein
VKFVWFRTFEGVDAQRERPGIRWPPAGERQRDAQPDGLSEHERSQPLEPMAAIEVGTRPFATQVVVVGRKPADAVRVVHGAADRVLHLSIERSTDIAAQRHGH